MPLYQLENGLVPGLTDAEIYYFPKFLGLSEATEAFGVLRNEVPWQQDSIKVFGKTHLQPRLTALYGVAGRTYTYSGIRMSPYPFTPLLLKLKEKVEAAVAHNFTSCLLNLYRDGRDSNGWHADNEKELGRQPVIASLSLGASRRFRLKHRKDKSLSYSLDLAPGSLLLMKGATQTYWLHQIPKTKIVVGERINLTFRHIY